MSEATQTPTAETPAPKKDNKKKEKEKAAPAVTAAPAAVATTADAADFPFEFLEDAKEETREINPKSFFHAPFDSRSDTGAPLETSFLNDIAANKILQPVLACPVRERKSGKVGLMLIAGRKRTAAAIELKFATIPTFVKPMTLRKALIACGAENFQRKTLTFWDTACYMNTLKTEYKMKQGEIAKELQVADSKVSQYLAVFDLDERVQKIVRKGQLEPGTNTKVRELKTLSDPDQQYALAVKAIEGEWTSDEIAEAVAKIKARQAAVEKEKKEKEKKEKEKAKASGEGAPRRSAASDEGDDDDDSPTFDPKKVDVVKKTQFLALLESVATKLNKLRAKNADAEKIAYERGRLDALKVASGLKAFPKSLLDD